MITEPDVTLTDYGLALECAVFSYYLFHTEDQFSGLRDWCLLFFAATGTAALAGGTVHGFFLDEATAGYAILWPATLLAIGAAALAAWTVGAKLLFPEEMARRVSAAALWECAGYAGVVLLFARTFFVAIVNYLPAALFLLAALTVLYKKTKAAQALIGIAGLLFTFIAAGIQLAGIAMHPVYFNHNALYHLIQASALYMMFRCFRWLVTASRT